MIRKTRESKNKILNMEKETISGVVQIFLLYEITINNLMP